MSVARSSVGSKIAGVMLAIIGFASFGMRQSGALGNAPPWLVLVEIAALVGIIVVIASLARRHQARKLRGRIKSTTPRCPLCGLDPSVDDSHIPPPAKRCIECGRVTPQR